MTELEALIILNQLPRIGPIRIKNLISYFGCPSEVLAAPLEQLMEVPQCSRSTATLITQWPEYSSLARELQFCEQQDISIITAQSENWPTGLNDLKDPPALLYVKGRLTHPDLSPVAVIGSRKTTHYGRIVSEQLTQDLALAGETIISGLALGIDTIAHEAALHADSRTIAVLGSGLGVLYPKENRELAESISAQGAVVSEFPVMTSPDKQTFPQRNRIVAAWAKATLVTEMPARSGAMITANFAKKLGRPVYAVPGPIDRPTSSGCHQLIKEGATLVTEARDLLKDFQPTAPIQEAFDFAPATTPVPPSNLTDHEKLILSHLTTQEQTIDELFTKTNLLISELSTGLLNLEIYDLAIQHAGMTYTTA